MMTAPIDVSVKNVSHTCGSARRCTAKNEISPAMTMLITAKARRSSATDAVVTSGATRS